MSRSIVILLLLLLFLITGSCSEDKDRKLLAEDAQEFLVHSLHDREGWVKVHVAEELLELGYRGEIKKLFLDELSQHGSQFQYRIGIRRVLAGCAENPEERKQWIDEIARVYADPSQPDRMHAAESLAKLAVNLNDVAPGRVVQDLTSRDTLMRAFVTWGTAVNTVPDSIGIKRLLGMLDSPDESFRRIGAYALGYLPVLPERYGKLIREKAFAEPDGSAARINLLKAAYLFSEDGLRPGSVPVKDELLRTFSSAGRAGRFEICMGLAKKGTGHDLPFLEHVFRTEFQGKPVDGGESVSNEMTQEDLTDIRAALAYSILRISQRIERKVTFPDYLVLVVYALLMLGIGFYYSRKNKNADDYNLGGRKMNPVLVGLSLFATLMSTLSYLSYPGEMVQFGPVYFAGLVSFPLVYYLAGWYLIPKFMEMKVTSAYEILEIKVGTGVRMMATFFFLSLRLLWMATIIYATVELAIVPIFGMPERYVPLTCLMMALITMVYTSLGGLRAVVITDSVQTVILILGALLTVYVIAAQLGSFAALFPANLSEQWGPVTWGLDSDKRMTVGNAFLMTFVWYICTAGSDQMAIQRYLSTKDVRAARKTFRISVITNFLVQLVLIVVGLALLAYFTKRPYELMEGQTVADSADTLFPRFILIGLPVGVTGIVIAGLVSAAMSSLSSGLSSSSAVISEDIIKRFFHSKKETDYLKQVRQISVLIGFAVTLLCFGVGYVQGNLLEVILKVVNLFVAPLFVLFFMALFIPFATQNATLTAGIVSTVVAILIAFFEIFGLKVLWIGPVSLVAGIVAGVFLSFIETRLNYKTSKSKSE
jgi:SSS family solute:Na+ symporter